MRRFVPTKPTSQLDNTQLVGKTILLNQAALTAKNSLLWGAINAVICFLVSYDFYYTNPWFTSYFHILEGTFLLGLAINTIFHFYRYVVNTFRLTPLFVNPQQKCLLGVKNSDSYIKLATPTKPADTSVTYPSTPMNLSATSWLSQTTPLNSSMSPNYTMSSPSWVFYHGSPENANVSTDSVRQRINTSNSAMLPTSSPDEVIEDELSLSQYLKEFEQNEKSACVSMSVEQPTNLLSSFWTHPATRTTSETSPMLRRCTYQLAPPSPPQDSGEAGGSADSNVSPTSSIHHNQELWRKVGVNPAMLTQWSANLRMWISETVLKRVVCEISRVDQALLRQGLSDVRVGAVGLERLRKTAQITTVALHVPTLSSLIAFLEVTPHQEYLVARIKDLAKGGCMSEFRWNGGGTLHGKNWEDHLPTDSTIVLHMFSTYLDSQLLPPPSNPDGRPFSSQYVVRSPNKPPATGLAIMETRASPPCFAVSHDGALLRPMQGQSNLFHSIILFIYLVKTKEAAVLGRVNLGPSGINMLWIVEE